VLSDVLGRLLLANAVFSLFSLVVAKFVHTGIVLQVLTAVALVLLLITGLAWCAWQWRMAVSSPRSLRHRPAGHVGAWFIPVANLWLPLENMIDLWEAYEPADDHGWGRDIFTVPWWTLWLASAALGAIGLRTAAQGDVLDDTLGVAWALAAVRAWLVVRRLSWRALLYHASLS
jgi:hypothetical protein